MNQLNDFNPIFPTREGAGVIQYGAHQGSAILLLMAPLTPQASLPAWLVSSMQSGQGIGASAVHSVMSSLVWPWMWVAEMTRSQTKPASESVLPDHLQDCCLGRLGEGKKAVRRLHSAWVLDAVNILVDSSAIEVKEPAHSIVGKLENLGGSSALRGRNAFPVLFHPKRVYVTRRLRSVQHLCTHRFVYCCPRAN